MRRLILVITSLSLVACGSGSSTNSAEAVDKSLFSNWVNSADSNVSMDLSGFVFGGNNVRIYMFTNAWCDCTLDLVGAESSGSADLYSCSWTGPGISQCPAGGVNYTFTNSGGTLTLCDTGNSTCETYY